MRFHYKILVTILQPTLTTCASLQEIVVNRDVIQENWQLHKILQEVNIQEMLLLNRTNVFQCQILAKNNQNFILARTN